MAGETEAQRLAHTPQQVGETQVSRWATPALTLGLLILQVSMSFGVQELPWGQLLRVHEAVCPICGVLRWGVRESAQVQDLEDKE